MYTNMCPKMKHDKKCTTLGTFTNNTGEDLIDKVELNQHHKINQ